MPNPKDTHDKLVWYVIATLTTLILTLTGAWAYDINTSLHNLEQRTNTIEKQYSSIESKLDLLIYYWDNSGHPKIRPVIDK